MGKDDPNHSTINNGGTNKPTKSATLLTTCHLLLLLLMDHQNATCCLSDGHGAAVAMKKDPKFLERVLLPVGFGDNEAGGVRLCIWLCHSLIAPAHRNTRSTFGHFHHWEIIRNCSSKRRNSGQIRISVGCCHEYKLLLLLLVLLH